MFAKFQSRYLVTELLPSFPRVFYIIIPLIEPPPLLAHGGSRLSIYLAPRPHPSASTSVFLSAALFYFSPTNSSFHLDFTSDLRKGYTFHRLFALASTYPFVLPVPLYRYSLLGTRVAQGRTHNSASRNYMAKRQ